MNTQSIRSAAVNETLARKVLETVDAGLVNGIGEPIPGQMCIEAAVCYAMGLPHSDKPTCVGAAVRAFKIRLNDASWSSDAARTAGMRKLAIAQLGSDAIDQQAFARIVAEQTTRQIVPIALRAAAKLNPKHADALEAAAVECEQKGDKESANKANAVAGAAASAASEAYAASAAYATYAACTASAASATSAASEASEASEASATYAAYAAYAASAASATSAAYAVRCSALNRCASIGLAALIELQSPGCAFLYLADG